MVSKGIDRPGNVDTDKVAKANANTETDERLLVPEQNRNEGWQNTPKE